MCTPLLQNKRNYAYLLMTFAALSGCDVPDASDTDPENIIVDDRSTEPNDTESARDTSNDTGSAQEEPSDTGSDSPLPKEPPNHIPGPAVSCDHNRDSTPIDPALLENPAYSFYYCTSHEDCTEGENGRCTFQYYAPGDLREVWGCTYDECFENADCSGPCRCGSGMEANKCLPGNCGVDEDCGEGGFCVRTPECYTGTYSYYCVTPMDECTSNEDCGEEKPYCAVHPETGARTCTDELECPMGFNFC